jgi:hypothetical protein
MDRPLLRGRFRATRAKIQIRPGAAMTEIKDRNRVAILAEREKFESCCDLDQRRDIDFVAY